jgi:diguanylate cyclase (GGDEF)-like protein
MALAQNEDVDATADRIGRLDEISAVWPFVVLVQMLAVGFLLIVGRIARPALIALAIGHGGPVLAFSIATLAVLKLRPCRAWPTHQRVRIVALAAMGMAEGLLALLWNTGALYAGGPLDLGAFIAVFGAITITAITLHPARAATLGFAIAMTVMVAIHTGFGVPTSMALLALGGLIVATLRLAVFDTTQLVARRAADAGGRRAVLLVREYEDHGPGWFWQTDRLGNLSYLSDKIARAITARGEQPIGERLTQLFRMDSDGGDRERTLSFHLSSRTSFSDYSVQLAGNASEERWFSISGRPLVDDLGRFQGFVGSGSDLTEKRRSEAEITRLALFDSLTGLANRQRMRLSIDKMLAPTGGPRRGVALLLLDLDRFKAVNDTLGHQVGDVLLKQVAQRLQRATGEGGLVGRLGGDEFQVVLPDEYNPDTLADQARAIIAALSQPYFIEGSSISIGCSIGIAVAPENGNDTETLTRNADLALYAAKADGRGIHRFFRDELLAGARTRKQLEDDLRNALAADQLHVAYQPVVSTRTEKIVGYEALVRWTHPTRGPISPSDFVPVAEECGLIEAIGEWVLRTACRDAAGWPGKVRVSVNVSPIQFANAALPAIVTSALAQSGLAPQRLELEITEGVFLNESSAADQMFKSLKAIGVRLALDDFGTGYSSLGYLKKAPFDKIKIDQSFVRGAAIAGNRNAAIIKAIVTLADTLGMETTAEGVELQDELGLVRELGCSHIQGFVYGRAVPNADVLHQLGAGGGVAQVNGHKMSRAPRTRMLRSATLDLGHASGEVRVRDISATGAMIDGIEFERDPAGTEIRIELIEGERVTGTLRWAKDGKAGIEFDRQFDLERLNQPAQRFPLRKSA